MRVFLYRDRLGKRYTIGRARPDGLHYTHGGRHPRELEVAAMALQPHERAAVERRIASIDRELASIHQGESSQVERWRKLLLEKEQLQQRLAGKTFSDPTH